MTATIPQLVSLLNTAGSDVTYHRESGGTPCPCRTPEGFRDPEWHASHPLEPVCNEEGFLGVTIVEIAVKAAVQPAVSRGVTRVAERVDALLGEVQQDDHIGIFPVHWGGQALDFSTWGDAGDDYVIYDGRRYIAVSADKLPDIDGDPDHHWEVGLRLVKLGRPT
jgi:hypothetical protein